MAVSATRMDDDPRVHEIVSAARVHETVSAAHVQGDAHMTCVCESV